MIKELIPEEITKSNFFQLSFALPFICYFYIINVSHNYQIPLVDFHLGNEVSALLDIIGVAIIYYSVLFMSLFFANLSIMVAESKFVYFLPVFSVLSTVLFGTNGGYSEISWLYAVFSALFLMFSVFNSNETAPTLSYTLAIIFGSILALTFFVMAISWYSGQYLFIDVVKIILEINQVKPQSIKIGELAMALIGYVFLYGVYKIYKDIPVNS
ncbi:hypothetical protein P8629_10645 [Hydrogenovibrio sp. 3SP14C1]|uniref:hypothetical protein n=1 Tax=Hydrogenovibrio sp. 3SP14C1 TaxID=3038774 RepID=UPI002417CD1A|nr:hypothetical protein [Hydrogenovibrio sp. 3SP14C1]MDG4813465.1 hypothetical protein [Hydrogenovibrio sp. 3SP14C1]